MSVSAFVTRTAAAPARGFMLVELLVALLVLDAGLLGLAALQQELLQRQQAAGLASDARWLAEDLVARSRANPDVQYRLASGATPASASNCTASACSPAAWAAADLSAWHTQLRLHLPLIEWQVEPAGNACRVRLRYRLPGGGEASMEAGP